jgi:hypothetical protein
MNESPLTLRVVRVGGKYSRRKESFSVSDCLGDRNMGLPQFGDWRRCDEREIEKRFFKKERYHFTTSI